MSRAPTRRSPETTPTVPRLAGKKPDGRGSGDATAASLARL